MCTGLLTALENPSLKRNHRGWVAVLLRQPGLFTVSVITKKDYYKVANQTAINRHKSKILIARTVMYCRYLLQVTKTFSE